MGSKQRFKTSIFHSISILVVVITLLASAGCSSLSFLSPQSTAASNGDKNSPSSLLRADVTFAVSVPGSTPSDAPVELSLLDEVTGLLINPTTYKMKPAGDHSYQLTLPLPFGAVVKYRYKIESTVDYTEYSASGTPIRYRMALVPGPETVQDIVAAWKDVPYSGETGQIDGRVTSAENGEPISGMLVDVAGVQALTGSDGSFSIKSLPVGTHNLVAYALDGAYRPFQQGARVATGLSTPANVVVATAKPVNVTFKVSVPKENVVGLPVRVAGNLLSLGDTFSDLQSGFSTLGSRMPLLTQGPDGSYSITLSLPAGTYLEYKYTLGDGFWNAELTSDGKFLVRRLVVPDQDLVVEDQVATWRSPNVAPVTFQVTAPAEMPAGDVISIQLNPFGWMEPVPMWSLGNGNWLFILYNPLNLVSSIGYRFCRNNQCGATTDPVDHSFKPDANSQSFSFEVQ